MTLISTDRVSLFDFLKPALPLSSACRRKSAAGLSGLPPPHPRGRFIGYATYYLVRNNLPVVSAEMGARLGYDKSMIGDILAATAISYGVGKLVMGWFSDRSSPRRFIALGLALTACLNFAFGASSDFRLHLALWAANGFVQGMGYGPCATSLAHWYGLKERGAVFGFWNMAHNAGGGLVGVIAAWAASCWGWRSAFFVPGLLALAGSAYLAWRMRDAPTSLGLPTIEEHLGEPPPSHDRSAAGGVPEGIFKRHILPNKTLWLIAFANFFVYIARYSMLDWGPTYLKEVKGASLGHGGLRTLLLEFSGALGMLATGWLSDRIGGRRGLVSAACIAPCVLVFWALTLTPPGLLWLDLALPPLIGFLVYAPCDAGVSLDLTARGGGHGGGLRRPLRLPGPRRQTRASAGSPSTTAGARAHLRAGLPLSRPCCCQSLEPPA